MRKTNLQVEALKAKFCGFIDYLGLFLIGAISLVYALYYSGIAKCRTGVSFLSVPIFVGEIIFAICLLLYFLQSLGNGKKVGILTFSFLFYFAFVLGKIYFGYLYWGPLALRHAAMFCYPFFAVFSFSFFRRELFKPRNNLFLIFLFIFLFKFIPFHPYFNLTCFILSVILINAYPKRPLKYVLYALLLLVFPYKLIFDTSRTFIAGNLAALLYLSFCLLYVSKIKKTYKIIFLLFFISFIFYGIAKNSDRDRIKSLVGFGELRKKYNENIAIVRAKGLSFKEERLEAKLYHENNISFQDLILGSLEERGKSQSKGSNNQPLGLKSIGEKAVSEKAEIKLNRTPAPLNQPVLPLKTEKNNDYGSFSLGKAAESKERAGMFNKNIKKEESLDFSNDGIDVAYGNSLFRIFIWQDAFSQLLSKPPVFGFDFGKPFRSRTIEILGWAKCEWARDGWICLHNSYIDIIYRAGIMGIIMIISIMLALLYFIVISLRRSSLTGILLTAILLNWLIAANFLEIMEAPYSAIPLWSLFGLTAAYLFKKRAV